MAEPFLQIHLEPRQPVDLDHLTAAFGAISRQYQLFIGEATLADKPKDAKLLVSRVAPGSIDIALVPDLLSAALIAPLLHRLDLIKKFAEHLRDIIKFFSEKTDTPAEGITARDCDDVAAIVRPVADRGGQQTFNIVQGDVIINYFQVTPDNALTILDRTAEVKAELQSPDVETRQRVAMIWQRLDRKHAKTIGARSPDKAVIEEVDVLPHAILVDELVHLKDQMVSDEKNPMQKVYFVDVEILRSDRRVVAYRVTGYHGQDDLQPSEESA